MNRLLIGVIASIMTVCVHAGQKTLRCGGLEPYWSVTFNNKNIHFDGVDGRKVVTFAKVSGAEGMQKTYLQTYLKSDNTPAAVVRKVSCSDQMSDRKYRQEIFFFDDGKTYMGCCRTVAK